MKINPTMKRINHESRIALKDEVVRQENEEIKPRIARITQNGCCRAKLRFDSYSSLRVFRAIRG
jgi:predicted nucleotidyltransferase